MYNIIYEKSRQSRFDARYWMLGAGALGRPRGMVRGGRREEGSGWGTRVYLWQIHVDIWQNKYNIVKLKNKIKKKEKDPDTEEYTLDYSRHMNNEKAKWCDAIISQGSCYSGFVNDWKTREMVLWC